MTGRKRKPTKLHLVQGTARRCRMPKNEPRTANDLPVSPSSLNKRATEYFGRLTVRLQGMGIASSSHTEMLALAAMRLDEVDALTEIIEAEGHTYISAQSIKDEEGKVRLIKLKKAHPAVAQRSDAARHAQSLLAEFGLSPSSVSKISSAPAPAGTTDGWGQLKSN